MVEEGGAFPTDAHMRHMTVCVCVLARAHVCSLGVGSEVLCALGKCCPTELHPSSFMLRQVLLSCPNCPETHSYPDSVF